jgi:hypothetical protein
MVRGGTSRSATRIGISPGDSAPKRRRDSFETPSDYGDLAWRAGAIVAVERFRARTTSRMPGSDPGELERLTFDPEGRLDDALTGDLRRLDPARLGAAVTTLLGRATDLPAVLAETAAESIAGLVWTAGDGPRPMDADPAALVSAYQLLADDPERRALRDLVLRLLRMIDPERIWPLLGIDRASFDLRRQLTESAAAEPAEDDGEGTRGLDEPRTGAERPPMGIAPPPPAAVPAPKAHAPTAAAPTAAEPPESTYAAYGLLESPERVVAGREFVLTVGLTPQPQAGVTGGAFDLPRPTRRPYSLWVQLIATGFDLRPGELTRIELKISGDDLFPTKDLHLTARDVETESAELDITAIYSLRGHPISAAIRKVRVLRSDQPQPAPTTSTSTGANMKVPAGDPPADVTLTIKGGIGGVLSWTLDSPLNGVKLPEDVPPTSSIGPDPQAYATNLVKSIQLKGTEPGLDTLLAGFGVEIHDAMPAVVREALAAANAAVAPDILSLLILTDEPYVPWELAQLDEPFDPSAPNHLGSQVNVARWVLAPGNMATIPPDAVSVRQMAVVWGVYTSAALPRLLEAEGEADDLKTGYDAEFVDAVPASVDNLLRGDPEADILHFAVHGRYDPDGQGDGIYLTQGRPVSPTQIRGGNLRARAPFVFLNACQVGSASQTLGSYGGIAQAFLRSGASAVVAPLWSVNDKVARSIALEFYRRVDDRASAGANAGSEPVPAVAELLRLARRKAITDQDPTSATYLAYQFYGHPSFRLTWQRTATGGVPHG